MTTVRRGRGSGTLKETRPGVWRLRVVRGYRPGGQPIQVSKTVKGTEAQAQRALARFVTEVEDGKVALSGAMTVRQFFDRWLPFVKANKSYQTWLTYRITADHACKQFGNMRLDKLRAHHLDAAYMVWLEEGVEGQTVRNRAAVISSALSQAIKWDLISTSPSSRSTRPRVEKKPLKLPTIEQVRNLIEVTDTAHPILSAAIFLAALTGARRGELLGLQWTDIDETNRILSIERSAKFGASGTVLGSTKTNQSRLVALDTVTLEVLRTHRLRAEKWASDAGVDVAANGFILTHDPAGLKPWTPSSLTRAFSRYAKKVGMEGVRFHDLRHVVASSMLANGVDVGTVAARLGHDPKVTLSTYAHVLDPAERKAAEVMGILLKP